jgi:hypothetical protein
MFNLLKEANNGTKNRIKSEHFNVIRTIIDLWHNVFPLTDQGREGAPPFVRNFGQNRVKIIHFQSETPPPPFENKI